MNDAVIARVCETCGYVAYPPRILCPVCGGRAWGSQDVQAGTVSELTTRRAIPEPRRLPSGDWVDQQEAVFAFVEADAGVRVVARVVGRLEVGDRVLLRRRRGDAASQAVEARAAGRRASAGRGLVAN